VKHSNDRFATAATILLVEVVMVVAMIYMLVQCARYFRGG